MKKLFSFLALIILVSLGCEKQEEETTPIKETPTNQTTQTNTPGRIVARVNGRPIYEADLGRRTVEDAVADEILYEEGLKRGLDKKLESQVEQYKKRLVVNTLKSEVRMTQVSNEEIENYYKENESEFRYLHVKEINVEYKNLAEEIRKKALSGEGLEKIASDYSVSGKNIAVTDLGFNRRYNNLFNGKAPGSVSDVIQEGNKFKVLKLIEVKVVPLSKVREPIRYFILRKKKNKWILEFAQKLKKENNINVEILGEEKK